jgi:hypothetical protein
MANLGRRSSPGTGPGWAEPGEPGRKACSQGSHWMLLWASNRLYRVEAELVPSIEAAARLIATTRFGGTK